MSRNAEAKPQPHEATRHGSAPALLAGHDGTEWLRFWMDQMLQGTHRQMLWWSNLHRLEEQAMDSWREAVRAAASEVEQATSAEELAAVPARYAQRLAELALRRATDFATAAAEAEKHWIEEARSSGAQAAAAWGQPPVPGRTG